MVGWIGIGIGGGGWLIVVDGAGLMGDLVDMVGQSEQPHCSHRL